MPTMKELRARCEELGITPARGLVETAERISAEEDRLALIEKEQEAQQPSGFEIERQSESIEPMIIAGKERGDTDILFSQAAWEAFAGTPLHGLTPHVTGSRRILVDRREYNNRAKRLARKAMRKATKKAQRR